MLASTATPTAAQSHVLVIKSRDIALYNQTLQGFVDGLSARGYNSSNGTSITTIALSGDSNKDSELVKSQLSKNVSLVYTLGSDATIAVQSAQTNVPCLFTMILDPVDLGIAKSLGQPGENFTGTTLLVDPGKQLQALQQVANNVKRVGVIYTEGNAISTAFLASAAQESPSLGIKIISIPVSSYQSGGHDALTQLAGKVDAFWLIVDPSSAGPQALADTLAIAKQNNLPVLGMSNSNVKAGALVSLSANLRDLGDVDAEMACQLLEGGVTASETPIRGPRQTILAINLISARQLGDTIPDSVLHLADEVVDNSLSTTGN